MTRTQWVSDEVWSQLDSSTGRLTKRQRRHALAAVSAAATVLVAGFAVDRSGGVRANIGYSSESNDAGAASPTAKSFTRQFAVKNNGWTTVRVTGVGQNGPGLHLVGPGDKDGLPKDMELPGSTPVPFDLHPGQIAIVAVSYHVTDCAAVPSGSFPVTLRVDRPWGTQTIGISLPMTSAPGNAHGLVSDTEMIGWQKEMADDVCAPPGS